MFMPLRAVVAQCVSILPLGAVLLRRALFLTVVPEVVKFLSFSLGESFSPLVGQAVHSVREVLVVLGFHNGF